VRHAEAPRDIPALHPNDKDLAASFLTRAQRAGYRAVVVTLDTEPLDGARGILHSIFLAAR